METTLDSFIRNSYERLKDYEKKGRYYHILTPNDNSPVVVHKMTNQLTYVIEGEGITVLNGKAEDIFPGRAILVEAGTTHQFIAKSNKLTLFHIHVPDEGRDEDRYIVEGDDYNRFTQ